MGDTFKPASYPPTDVAENSAVDHLRSILNPKLAKHYLQTRDKVPNTDGFLELVQEETPIGKIEVQVRSIPKGATSHQCPTSLYAYAKVTTLPIILVAVDVADRKAFWKQIKLEDISGRERQQTVTLHFNEPEDLIDANERYIGQWRSIIAEYQERIENYAKLKAAAGEMADASSISPDVVTRLQVFTDELNHLLDHEYPYIKRLKFPGVWKIGIGLRGYTKERVSYSLFAVEQGRADSLIKTAPSSGSILELGGKYFRSSMGSNQFEKDPKLPARTFIYHELQDFLQHRLFLIRQPFLRNEYLVSFIDQHLYCLGLDQKDSYGLNELIFAFHEYLPRWCATALKYSPYPNHLNHIDPGVIRMLLPRNIDAEVRAAVEKNETFPRMVFGGLFYSFRLIFDLLADCRQNQIQTIDRIYRKPTPSLRGHYIWDPYTDEDVLFNLRQVVDNFDQVAADFLILNELGSLKLRLFPDAERIVGRYEGPYPSVDGKPPKDHPTLELYELESMHGAALGNRFTIELKKNLPFNVSDDDTVEFEGAKYHASRTSLGGVDFIFTRTPMLEMIYKQLGIALKQEFAGAGTA